MAQKLFDKASLVMIPSQYKEGKVYNIKPEDQSSSFEFERGSAATRVNSSGLIEYVGVGEELATATNWTNGPTYDTNTGTLTAINLTSNTSIDVNIENDETYLITYTIVSITSAGAGVRTLLGGSGGWQQPYRNQPGTYTEIATYPSGASIDKLYFSINGTTSFEITDISLKQISNDTPRLDYSGTEPALLLEPQRTNLLPYSKDFEEWDKNLDTTLTSNNEISPDGTQNATLVVCPTTGGRVGYNVGLISGNTYTFSVYLKNNGGNTSIDMGSHTTSQLETVTINDEWNRYSITFTSTSTTTSSIRFVSQGSNINLHAYGAQLEQGSYATSYIPTNGQTETRLADVCKGGGDASVFNDSEGVLYGEISGFDVDSTSKVIALNSGVVDNSVAIFYYQSTVRLSITNSGAVQAYITHNLSDVKDTIKFAIKYNTNDIGFWVNGVEVGTDTTATPPTGLDRINFDRYDGGNKFYGNVKALHYFPEALTDTELQQLTTI